MEKRDSMSLRAVYLGAYEATLVVGIHNGGKLDGNDDYECQWCDCRRRYTIIR